MNRTLIGMSASRGGLAVFETILPGLPDALAAAVVLLQHRAPEGGSGLRELLQRHTKCPVVEPDDQAPIEMGTIYLAPAGYHLSVESNSFSLALDGPVCYARPSADVLFESMASFHGKSAIAVVLTSSSADGAFGASRVHAAGGRVIVQSPSTATSPESILKTMALCKPDAIVAPSEVASVLVEFCDASPRRAPRRGTR